VDIDDYGRVAMCQGYAATARTESTYSLWSDHEFCLFASPDSTGASLYRLNPDYSRTGLRSYLTKGAPLDYTYANGQVYYCNGFENGYITADNLSHSWVKGTYYGVETFRRFSDPPVGHLLAHFDGRIYIAQDNTVWFSEPFAFSAFDLARNYFLYSSRIQMLKGVSKGIYVSDSQAIYFIEYKSPDDIVQKKVYGYPAISGSAIVADAISLQLADSIIPEYKKSEGPILLCATEKGICVGTSDGIFKNITLDKVTYPSSNKAAAAINGNSYVCLLQE
jgi:hypothetical protein